MNAQNWCNAIISTGKNKGKICTRKTCMFHPTIADFLVLPPYFKESTLDYNFIKFLIKNYKYCNTPYKDYERSLCCSFMDTVLKANKEYSGRTRKLLAIYLIKLLDTPKMVTFRLHYKKLNDVVYKKLEEFSNDEDEIFSSYFKSQFEPNKKYLHKSKNRIVLLRNYIIARRCFISLYKSKKVKS
jgi:hypothetical protein